MSSTVALSALLAAAAALSGANAQSSSTSVAPLAAQTYAYADLPYQVEPYGGERGNQVGYNKCNSTTENQDSLCQTLIANAIDDFCLWSSPKENETIGDTEAYEVAWCSKKGHGARAMPDGTLQGVSVIRTPDYVMYAGFLDQVQVNLAADDYGGELDPHGADLMGNPMGGMVYSNQYPKGNTDNNTLTQVVEWKQFIGGNQFCLMICDPSKTDANNVGLCENRYDEVGISYNCPNSAQKGKYEVCDGDSMSPIGQYVSNGVTTTWTQPWSGSWTVPYTATVPSSSNCRTFASTDLYTAGVKPTVSASGSAAGGSGRNTFSPLPAELPVALLRLQVIGCRDLVAKDKSGLSDPFVAVSLLRDRHQTGVVKKTINPVYAPADATFDFPIYLSLADRLGVVEFVVWDKDMLRKDYLGEANIPLEDWFRDGNAFAFDDAENKPISAPIVSTRVSIAAAGTIQFKLGFVSPADRQSAQDFSELFSELVKRSRPSLVSAPPTEGIGTIRSNQIGPEFQDDGLTSDEGESSDDDEEE
ncbi:hypothetical protein EVJ58_g10146, partial [Rhodofomes roseus]